MCSIRHQKLHNQVTPCYPDSNAPHHRPPRGQRPEGTASGTLAAVRCMRWLGIGYFGTVARAAQARVVNEIEPSAAVGRRPFMRSRKGTLAVSSSDIA